jgi:hypothetical protein
MSALWVVFPEESSRRASRHAHWRLKAHCGSTCHNASYTHYHSNRQTLPAGVSTYNCACYNSPGNTAVPGTRSGVQRRYAVLACSMHCLVSALLVLWRSSGTHVRRTLVGLAAERRSIARHRACNTGAPSPVVVGGEQSALGLAVHCQASSGITPRKKLTYWL